jgi:protein-disulfide isomerase/uncharacterized membrane protein
MNERRRLQIAVILLLAGLVLSGVLLLHHYGESSVAQVCGADGESGCDRVNQSRFAELGGVPLAGIGLVFYASLGTLLALALLAPAGVQSAASRLALYAVGVALVADIALLAVQASAIGVYCPLCLTTYAVNVVLLLLLWPQRKAATATLLENDGRLVAGGWLLASLACVLAVWAGDGWLRARAQQRAGSILGTPLAATPAAAPSPSVSVAETTSASAPADLQQKVRQLQETLDDPQKLQQYLNDKSMHEFESASVQKLDMDAPVEGSAQAAIKAVEFSDFMCPFCRNLALGLKDYVPQAKGRVAVYFKNYPLDQTCNPNLARTVHVGACALAIGGICARQQGKFWEYHDRVFAQPIEQATAADARRFAVEAGLDGAKLDTCMASSESRKLLDAQIAEGVKVGVNGTPTVLINGRKVPNLNLFLQMIDKEAARLGLPPVPPPAPPPAHP